jgi:hypothetical protein
VTSEYQNWSAEVPCVVSSVFFSTFAHTKSIAGCSLLPLSLQLFSILQKKNNAICIYGEVAGAVPKVVDLGFMLCGTRAGNE